SLFIDEEGGYVYVLQRDAPFMYIFTLEGDYISEWYNKDIVDGHYFKITSEGKVFIVERDKHRIIIQNNQGVIERIIGDYRSPGLQGKPFNHPTDIAIADSGEFFVSDGYGNHCVHHFNSNGTHLKSWGKPGDKKGEFSVPHSILIDKRKRVLVADRENNRVQIFNQNGEYLEEINKVYKPMDIFEDKQGFIYISDQSHSLNKFSGTDAFIGRCRTFGTYGHGISVDKEGNIYIAEQFHDQITKLTISF